ncbi:g11700 [Coccomyxa viridis]|uniref:G11700 protein n=1 Tax=Coccomyxa viridis TaxID=1274662 RepID=A0ABP1G8J2_9CHLO
MSAKDQQEPLLGEGAHPQEEEQPGETRDVESQPRQNAASAAGVSVMFTTFIMLGDMLGLGSLTLPSVFARLGWIPALIVVIVCGFGTMYSGRLFALLATKVSNARVFDDFGGAAMGAWGRRFTYVTVYATILAEPIIFHLTSMEALQQIFYGSGITPIFAAIVVAAVMIPLSQIQGIEEVSAVSVIGSVGMVWALAVIAVKLCLTPKVDNYVPTALFPERSFSDAPDILVAVFDTVFTFGGQVNWVRYLMSMQHKRKFPIAVANVSAVMEVMYIMIGCVGYYRLGSDFDKSKPVTSVLPQDIWTSLANVGLLAHCIVAYMINLNVWTHLVIHLIKPSKQREDSDGEQRSSRGAWAVTSVIGIALSGVISVSVPFFDVIVAAIGALGDLAAAYALPALFVLVLMGSHLPRWERILCSVLIPLTLLLSVVGIGSSVASLVSKVKQH